MFSESGNGFWKVSRGASIELVVVAEDRHLYLDELGRLHQKGAPGHCHTDSVDREGDRVRGFRTLRWILRRGPAGRPLARPLASRRRGPGPFPFLPFLVRHWQPPPAPRPSSGVRGSAPRTRPGSASSWKRSRSRPSGPAPPGTGRSEGPP